MVANTLSGSTVLGIPKVHRPLGLGTKSEAPSLHLTCGLAVAAAESQRFSALIGRTARRCTCPAIVRAFLVTRTGESKCLQRYGALTKESSNTWSLCMNFSIVRTICRLFGRDSELSCSWLLWRRLLTG